MRVEFVNSVHAEMAKNQKSVFLTGDLGFNAFEGLVKDFGPRFINAGAAEQNMIGVAAGLALEGHQVWTYSIAPFVTYRCMEQIRNDVCLHDLPVCMVGNGGGYTYGIMGATHHTLEDMAVLKALPNMHLHLPCSNNQVEVSVQTIAQEKRPAYLRLGFTGFQSNAEPMRENAKTLTRVYAEGDQCTLIGIGQGTQIILHALENHLVPRDRVSVFGIARYPFQLSEDRELLESVQKTKKVLVVEEHYLPGSLAESLRLELSEVSKFDVLAPYYSKEHRYGKPAFQLEQVGVTPQRISQWVEKTISQ